MASRVKTALLAVATVATAGAIGYNMQYGSAAAPALAVQLNVDDISAVETTSSQGAVAPRPLAEISIAPPAQPEVAIVPQPLLVQSNSCDPQLSVVPAAGAMIDVSVLAPCHANERVTLYHYGLSISETMGPDGRLSTRLPALLETAIVLAEFADGAGGSATTTVSSLPFYDRVVLQWRGDAGLQLHAREFGAPYFAPGHVWADAPGDLGAAAQGQGGFLVSLGDTGLPNARLAEVYSFPTGTARRSGVVEITIEAEVTAENCGQQVEAQTIQHRADRPLEARDLDVQILGCAVVGDFLVLKNLVDDLTIRAR